MSPTLANGRCPKARAFVIATGSRPPAIPGLKEAGYSMSKSFSCKHGLSCQTVIGGGPIGCELGQAFSAWGPQVTLISGSERLCPKEDPEYPR